VNKDTLIQMRKRHNVAGEAGTFCSPFGFFAVEGDLEKSPDYLVDSKPLKV
jgi:hypothetical protein